MKNIVLTGIAEETSLLNPENGSIFLVFNEGELRVPIDPQAAQYVLEYYYSNNPDINPLVNNTEEQPEEESPNNQDYPYHDFEDEDAPIPTLSNDDDDGVNQI